MEKNLRKERREINNSEVNGNDKLTIDYVSTLNSFGRHVYHNNNGKKYEGSGFVEL